MGEKGNTCRVKLCTPEGRRLLGSTMLRRIILKHILKKCWAGIAQLV
jgi:hypothetical protein